MSSATPAAAPRVAPENGRAPRAGRDDLSIRVATVNGSGSQSANLVLLRALHAMGLPCSGKNVFPSNIEGLPTWFNLRANRRGHVAHRPDADAVVCMNEQTVAADVAEARPGAVVLVREELAPLVPPRDDVRLIVAPFARLAEQAYPADRADKGYRDKLRKVVNMVYVGVLGAACGIPRETIAGAVAAQFPGRKARAGAVNARAAEAGYDWADANLPADLDLRIEPSDQTAGTVLVDGNTAAAVGALFGGVSVLSWYPITPSSSLAETAEDLLKAYRRTPDGRATYAIVQAEDELAAVGMAVGAGWAGARALTATSGPGISLMAEFVGLAYFAEIPIVIVDVQRMGPSTGLPTRTSQGDVQALHLLGHGDARHPVYLPGSADECYADTVAALDLAQELQAPVFIATDLDLGMNLWMTPRLEYPERPIARGKVLDADDLARLGQFARYRDADGDGVGARTLPGTEHPLAAYFTRGTGHDETSAYSERPEVWKANIDRLARKLRSAHGKLPAPVIEESGQRVGLIAYGSTAPALIEARDLLADAGTPVDLCRVRALPITAEVIDFVARHEVVHVVDQNRDGQMAELLRAALPDDLPARVRSIRHYDGTPISAADIMKALGSRE